MIDVGQSAGPKEATADIIYAGITRIIRYAICVTNWAPAEVEFLPFQPAPQITHNVPVSADVFYWIFATPRVSAIFRFVPPADDGRTAVCPQFGPDFSEFSVAFASSNVLEDVTTGSGFDRYKMHSSFRSEILA